MGPGSLWRTKLGIVAEMLRFDSSDDFARSLGPKWAYHLKPVIELLSLPVLRQHEAGPCGWVGFGQHVRWFSLAVA